MLHYKLVPIMIIIIIIAMMMMMIWGLGEIWDLGGNWCCVSNLRQPRYSNKIIIAVIVIIVIIITNIIIIIIIIVVVIITIIIFWRVSCFEKKLLLRCFDNTANMGSPRSVCLWSLLENIKMSFSKIILTIYYIIYHFFVVVAVAGGRGGYVCKSVYSWTNHLKWDLDISVFVLI